MTSRAPRASRAPESGANAPRVLLIEDADLVDADELDAHERVVALRAAGARVRAVVVSAVPRSGAAAAPGRPAAAASRALGPEPADAVDASGLTEIARAEPHDLVLIASPRAHGGPLARRLAGDRALWLPTGFAAPARWSTPRGFPRAFAHHPAEDGAGVDGCVTAPPNGGRVVLPLWDGDYVLGPTPLEGRAGAEALTAFARIAAERSGVDLVVLADPQPVFERLARRLGIAPRVHFVGPAPRGAQRAWWSLAAAAIFAGERPIPGGVVLRGVESRCPMLAASTGAAATLGRWLAAREFGPRRRRGSSSLASALRAALDRDNATRAAIERGLALTRDHDAAALTARFAALLREGTASRRAA